MRRWVSRQKLASRVSSIRAPSRFSSAFAQPQPAHSHSHAPPPPLTGSAPRVDPYGLVAPELTRMRSTLLHLVGSSHPALAEISKYYFLRPSKMLRPVLVLLFARATNGLGQDWEKKKWEAECSRGKAEELDAPLTRADVLNDFNPCMPDHTASFQNVFSILPPPPSAPHVTAPPPSFVPSSHRSVNPLILPTQIRLAQITEMIHVASLLHDDVIDTSPLRRGVPSAPAQFGNKLSILGGDFLLGRASAALSRLGDAEVVELMASIIANLVEGEVMQVKEVYAPETLLGDSVNRASRERWNVYLKKTYLKTASLIAKSSRSAVVLGGSRDGEVWKEVAYAYGRNLGIAFQLVDDMLDFVSDTDLGKPNNGADLRLGLATAPALYAWEENAAMGPLIERHFEKEGDVELACDIVRRSSALERTRELARAHAEKAREVLSLLPESEAREALEVLTDPERVVKRTK